MLVNLKSDCYELQIITKNIENQYLKVSIKNNSKKTLAFYNGLYQTDFKIIDNDGEENVGEGDELEEAGESSLSGTLIGGKL